MEEIVLQAKTAEDKNAIQEYQKVFDYHELKDLVNHGSEIIVDDVNQTELINDAREIRLKLKKARVIIENKRKELKESINLQGKAIDGMANVLKGMIVPAEKHLEDQERFIEIQEEKRLSEIEEIRKIELSKYISDCSFYDLRKMPEATFEQLLKTSEIAYEAEKEAERKAEEERLKKEQEEKEESERIRKENEELKKEADRKRVEEEKRQEEEQKKLLKEQEKREMAEAEAKALKEEKEKIEEKLRLDAELKEKEKQEQEERIKAASDNDKIEILGKLIYEIQLPKVKSKTAQRLLFGVQEKLSLISTDIKKHLAK